MSDTSLSFRPRSGNYESEYEHAAGRKEQRCSFRPRSGNYESEYMKKMIEEAREMFPSPLGELWIWIKNERRKDKMKKGFRPRSGNYESEFNKADCQCSTFLFPSPLGELWIWIYSTISYKWYNVFPSPLGELWIWIMRDFLFAQIKHIVSVPARGIMNLNLIDSSLTAVVQSFRPRSGNYESE